MSEPTLEEIIHARNECAQIITLQGKKYLPIFERLENEISKRREQNKLLEKALKIGTQNGTQIGTQLTAQFFTVSK